MREAPVDLESTLDRLIGRLAKPGAPREARALLLDAKRLRSLVGNWKTIAPTQEALKEMSLRVEQLHRSADAAVPESVPPPEPSPSPPPLAASPPPPAQQRQAAARPAQPRQAMESPRPEPVARPAQPRPEPQRDHLWDDPPSLIIPVPVAARTAPPLADEPTRAAPIATQLSVDNERSAARALGMGEPVRARTLPDLDISGIAQLMDDSPGLPFEDALDSGRATVARNTRFDSDTPRIRPAADDPSRLHPSSTPPNGRRRAEPGATFESNRASIARPSRFFDDSEPESGAAAFAQGRATPPDEPVPQRLTQAQRSSSHPPVNARGDKTMIAVRPLPAPEVLDKRLILLNEPYSTRADAFRDLRRKLSGPGAPRTIAVTSAQPQEGKTSCAVNLALAFRETSSEKVLLVEANLRAPALAKLFAFEPPVCFAKQMAKNRDLPRASWTVVEQFEPLHVLAVDPASKTSPLLDPVAFANALEQLVEAGYDHIIVDTPSAIGGSDVNLIADAVDGIVIVAWIKKSKKSMVKKAIEQLKPATILGVVTLDG